MSACLAEVVKNGQWRVLLARDRSSATLYFLKRREFTQRMLSIIISEQEKERK